MQLIRVPLTIPWNLMGNKHISMTPTTRLITWLFALSAWGCGGDADKKLSSAKKLSPSQLNDLKNKDIDDLTYDQAYDLALTLWPVPFKELVVPTSHGNASVIVSGPENAEPLVLLHGMNASSTMWYPNIEALSGN